MNDIPSSPFRRRNVGGTTALALALVVLQYATPAMARSPIGKIEDLTVEETGLGPENDGCPRFKPSAREIRRFFERSIIITGRQRHDRFDEGPCFARGTLRTAFGEWAWEMRNLGTGELRSITDDVFLVGDPSRQSSIADE